MNVIGRDFSEPRCGLIHEHDSSCFRVYEGEELTSQGRLGAELLSMRRRAPKAPLSKLHDKMLGRSA